MNAVQFKFEALEGQKTGAFLDQRENYAAAVQYAHGEALDAFCYQGGFALHVAPGCAQVCGVDSSRPALEVAEQNAALNHAQLKDKDKEIEWIEANAFDLLKDYSSSGQRYDTIILDPPAFAKSKPRPENASPGGDSGHLLVFLSRELLGVHRNARGRGPGCSAQLASDRGSGTSQRPPDPAEYPGNRLPQVRRCICNVKKIIALFILTIAHSYFMLPLC
jgi:hypothetical protein